MLQKMTDRVLICLPDGRWLALSADLFRTHMSRSTVYELAKAGVLPCVRVGRRIRFDREKVMTVLASRPTAELSQ
jgi:excisionase family DNA binding protein